MLETHLFIYICLSWMIENLQIHGRKIKLSGTHQWSMKSVENKSANSNQNRRLLNSKWSSRGCGGLGQPILLCGGGEVTTLGRQRGVSGGVGEHGAPVVAWRNGSNGKGELRKTGWSCGGYRESTLLYSVIVKKICAF